MWKRGLWLLLLLPTAGAAACSDDDDNPGSSANYRASCRNACMRINQCDNSEDVEECSSDCEESLADIGPHLSRQYAEAVDACIAEADCATLLNTPVSLTCQQEARATIGATPAATSFCEASREAAQECSVTWFPQADCIDIFKVFSDQALSNATACRERPCGERLDCVREALGTDTGGMQ